MSEKKDQHMLGKESAVHPALADLKRAKAESDRKNYSAKNQILSELLGKHPDEFVQDSIQGRTIGLTHQPTGFKLHAPAMVVQGRAAPQPLYHGSATPDIKQFEPRTSRVLGGEKAVFGTPDRDLAISFGQPWHDEDFEQGYVNRKPYMREQYPGAFQKIYGGKPGTLYTLPSHGFAPDPRLMQEERINRGAVTPAAAEHIPDMLAALRATRFKMYPYRKRTKTAAIPLCMIKVALTPAEIAEAQRVRDATQAKQDYNDRYWGQTLLSPAVALGNAMTRAGYAGRGALYGAGGAGLGVAALFPQGVGRAGQALGVPGANNLTAASDAFASKNWNASGAGFKDVGSYLSDAEMPTGNVNAVGTENREMFDQAGENVLGTAYRGADWTGHLATQAIPGLGLGKGLGMVGQGIAKVAPRATQAISTATRAAGPAGNYAADTVGKLGQGASAPLTGPVSGAWQAARTMTPMTTIGKEVVTRGYNALPTTAAPANAQTPPVGMAAQHKATTTPAPAMATKPTPAPAIASPPPKKLPTTPGVPGIKTAADKQLVRVKVDAGDGKFLLHHYIRANTWDHPAGKAEPGESLPEAAARELHERAGYHVDPAHLTHTGQEGAFTTFTVPLAKTRRISTRGGRWLQDTSEGGSSSGSCREARRSHALGELATATEACRQTGPRRSEPAGLSWVGLGQEPGRHRCCRRGGRTLRRHRPGESPAQLRGRDQQVQRQDHALGGALVHGRRYGQAARAHPTRSSWTRSSGSGTRTRPVAGPRWIWPCRPDTRFCSRARPS